MPGPQPRLHLPFRQWPLADRLLWQEAMIDHEDPFNRAAGAHLAESSRRQYLNGWRRFLGFLTMDESTALAIAPAERLTKERVKRFVCHLNESNTSHSVAIQVDALYKAARIMMPQVQLSWLKTIKARGRHGEAERLSGLEIDDQLKSSAVFTITPSPPPSGACE